MADTKRTLAALKLLFPDSGYTTVCQDVRDLLESMFIQEVEDDIDDPSTELNAITGVADGTTLVIVRDDTDDHLYSLYVWSDSTETEDPPYIVDGSSGKWIRIATNSPDYPVNRVTEALLKLTQSGTGNPTVTEIFNNTGLTLDTGWTRTTTGKYELDLGIDDTGIEDTIIVLITNRNEVGFAFFKAAVSTPGMVNSFIKISTMDETATLVDSWDANVLIKRVI